MSLRLGIDTGGTFTDAVLIDDAERVVAAAKALTTRYDLSIGIAEAVRRVRATAAEEIGLVCLSTTLATNAVVEARGGRVGLLLIGLAEASLQRGGLGAALSDAEVAFVDGGHRADGSEEQPLDRLAAEAAIARMAPLVEAFAVCGQFAVRNPAHERDVAAIARAAGRPATCSHELTARLDAPRRALTTLLNARLIPEIVALLDAVETMLAAERIEAPLMVVTGDGSLISAASARLRPIETLLSGPAASIVGAAFLAGVDDALVADVGGTTTDIALLRAGRPRLSRAGAVVGGHATMVEAIEVHTAGLGGDSEVRLENGEPLLGPRRLVPLSLLASQWPGVLPLLREQATARRLPRHAGRMVLRRRSPVGPGLAGSGMGRLWALLETGPVSLQEIVDGQHLGLALQRLLGKGFVMEAGFTPTDAAHVLGLQEQWSAEAAELGATILGRLASDGAAMEPQALARAVMRSAEWRTAELLLEAALAAEGEPAAEIMAGPARSLLRRAVDTPGVGLARLRIELGCPIVAVGGPARLFYPGPAARLGTELVVPPHHATCNAVGAVVGRVERRATVVVAASADGGWRVHLPEGPQEIARLDTALELAEAVAGRLALGEASAAGATGAELRCLRNESAFVDASGTRHVLVVELVAVATGRPAAAAGEASSRCEGSHRSRA